MTIMETLRERKAIAIVRGLSPEIIDPLAQALYDGGIGLLEVTFQQDKPGTWKATASAIGHLCSAFDGRMRIGAGTVMTTEQLHLAADAGAQYIISPGVSEAVIRETKRLGLLSLPGALTPTEIANAYSMGADAVKIFPAGIAGPKYIKAVRAPISHIPLLAVGGIDADNCAAFLKAGCIGVGVGGSLVNKQWIADGDFDKITALAGEFVRNMSR